MNIISPIVRHAKTQPEKVALLRGENSLTYAQVVRRAGRAAAELVQQGVKPGDAVGLRCEAADFVVMTLAVAWAGAVSVPFSTMPKEQLDRLCPLVGVSFLVCNEAQKLDVMPPGVRGFILVRDALNSKAPEIPVADCAEDATWRIGFSSGTTGERKAIRFSHASGAARSKMLSTIPRIRGERTAIHLGYALTFAVVYWMRELSRGTSVALISSKGDALEQIEAAQPDLLVSSPGNAIDLLRVARESGREIPKSITTLMLGGAAVSVAHRKLLREELCDNLWINYGATEMGLVALLGPELMDKQPACAGRVMPWVEVQAVDAEGKPVEAQTPGVLRMRSPMMASSYILPPDARESDAHAFDDGWFLSGDRGFVTGKGLLFLAGRESDVVNLGGNKIDPGAVERVIEQHAGVLECAVVPVQHREGGALRLFAFIVSDAPIDEASIVSHCSAHLPKWQMPHRFIRAKDLPRNESGKVMRAELLKRLRRNPAKVES
jgi:acyl-coenzyme A synthetase/AMP-(fatty) acid ligase